MLVSILPTRVTRRTRRKSTGASSGAHSGSPQLPSSSWATSEWLTI